MYDSYNLNPEHIREREREIKLYSGRHYLSSISDVRHTNARNDTVAIFDSKEFGVTTRCSGVGRTVLLVYESRYYFIVCVEIDNVLAITIYFPSVIRAR